MQTLVRIRHEVLGGHVHMRVFVGKGLPNLTLGLAGNLVMRDDEFADFKRELEKVSNIHFLEEMHPISDERQV